MGGGSVCELAERSTTTLIASPDKSLLSSGSASRDVDGKLR
jgi:hypothetical protein